MIIRLIEPRDHAKLQAIYDRAPSKFGNPDLGLEGKNFITGYVAVDDNDEPWMLLGFHRTAEARVVLDHDYDVPAFRLVALGELIRAAKPHMIQLGYEYCIGTIGPDVPRGYLKRLKAFGCGILENWTLAKMWKENPR